MLVWIDVETTGLLARTHRLIEVACIVTDDQLAEVARKQWVTNQARQITHWSEISKYVLEMHSKNGLWGESLAIGQPLSDVDRELTEFITEHAPPVLNAKGKAIKPTLAGSTVSFDRGFLEVHTPRAADALGYRHLDVSSIMEMAMRVWPGAYEDKPADKDVPHRAMPDIEASLAMARRYAKALAPVTQTNADIVRWAYERNHDPSDANAYDELLNEIQKFAWRRS